MVDCYTNQLICLPLSGLNKSGMRQSQLRLPFTAEESDENSIKNNSYYINPGYIPGLPEVTIHPDWLVTNILPLP